MTEQAQTRNEESPPATNIGPAGEGDAASAWPRLGWKGRLPVVLTLIVLAVTTVPHLPPGVCFSDGGDLQVASATLGIMHPPGYPGFVTLGYLVTRLPWIQPAYAVSFACLVAGLTALLLGILICARLGVNVWLACAGFLLLTTDKHIWYHLVAPEIYAPSLAVLLGAVYLLIKYARLGHRSDLYWAGFLFGFVVANRPTAVWTFPFFVIAWLCVRKRWDGSWRQSLRPIMLTGLCVVLPGLYAVGFLWVRDNPQTAYNYIKHHNNEWHYLPEPTEGVAAKARRVYWHLTAREFERHMKYTWKDVSKRLKIFLFDQFFLYRLVEIVDVPLTIGPLTFVLLIPVLLYACVITYRRCRATFWLMLGLGVGNTIFIATYHIHGQAADLSPLMVGGLVMLTAGLSHLLIRVMGGYKRLTTLVSITLMGLCSTAAFLQGNETGARTWTDAEGFLAEVDLGTMPPESAICSTWKESPALWYAKHVLTNRDDIEILNTTTSRWSERIERQPVDRPSFAVFKAPQLDAYRPTPFRNLWRLQRPPVSDSTETNRRN